MKKDNNIGEVACAICGKMIYISDPSRWGYKVVRGPAKDSFSYACSWSCFRKFPAKAPRGRKSGKKDLIIELIRQGKRPCEIMDETGCTEWTVRYWSDRMNIGG